ncbi:hypothetical protein V6N11_060122 [Hibiscus sabdariffa]|uniref:Uncharacterized protein n=1 Tax=Hibiscus sabdariffa TaxID=183260 RepID=A0ABR2P3A0_9ROSI
MLPLMLYRQTLLNGSARPNETIKLEFRGLGMGNARKLCGYPNGMMLVLEVEVVACLLHGKIIVMLLFAPCPINTWMMTQMVFFFGVVHALEEHNKVASRDLLRNLNDLPMVSWLVIGDFNEFLFASESEMLTK